MADARRRPVAPDVDRPGTVGALAVRREAIDASVSCFAVDQQFRAAPAVRSLLVSGATGGVSLLNRSAFYQALVGPKGFGWALFHRRPVAALMDHIDSAPLVLDASTPTADAGIIVLRAQQVASGDDVLVSWGDGQFGTLSTAVLFSALAEHHEAQGALSADRERRFRALVEHLPDVIMVVGADGTVAYVSGESPTMGGAPPAELVGVPAAALVHPEDTPAWHKMVARCLAADGAPVHAEVRMQAGGGAYRQFTVIGRDLLHDPAVGGIVVNYRDVTEQRVMEDRLRHQAMHDPLTGQANRVLLRERTGHALSRLRRSAGATALLYLDLDGFKNVNDVWGHKVGDHLLQGVAEALARALRAEDTLARLGGDEFAVLIDELPGPADAAAAASRLHDALDQPFVVAGKEVRLRASIGLAVTNDPGLGPDELLRRSDVAMYAAKAQGKNRTVAWTPALERDLVDEDQLAVDLRSAVVGGQLFVEYQPIVAVSSGETVAVEALARWRHPERGVLAPIRFIPLAERTGLINEIGAWVLDAACAHAKTWTRDNGDRSPRVSVNLSAAQLGQPDLATSVGATLARHGLPPGSLELEITETALIPNVESARQTLEELRRLGVRIAIDDFGTGYSSLSYLSDLPVDTIKIDKSFIDRLGGPNGDTQLVEGIIMLAHSLGLSVVAEGIEQAEQAVALESLACDAAQGHFYGRPVEPDCGEDLTGQLLGTDRTQT